MYNSFKPMWASPPGDTISDLLSSKSITYKQFAKSINFSQQRVIKLIEGKVTITNKIAEQLEHTLGPSKSFWMNRESQFQEDLIRYTEERNERNEWIKLLPSLDMVKNGWIKSNCSKEIECLKFFNVSTVDEWYQKYNNLLSVTSFRTSGSFDSTPESVVTWLRRGEIVCEAIVSSSWDQAMFMSSLHKARNLTRESNPEIFIPKLQEIFSKCGVAVVVEKSPKLCRASGAAFFLSPQKAVIMLSARHLTDDHFWFSFFHEAGHLVLHGNIKLFLEFDGINKSMDDQEKEADKFAEKILIPEQYREEFLTLKAREWRSIIRFAKRINTSPGVVLGQLQYINKIDYRYLNKLKTRYKWSGSNLVQA